MLPLKNKLLPVLKTKGWTYPELVDKWLACFHLPGKAFYVV